MELLVLSSGERVKAVQFSEDTFSVELMDGRIITVPLIWYPRLLNATPDQSNQWEVRGGGYGIRWDALTKTSAQKLLCGAPVLRVSRWGWSEGVTGDSTVLWRYS